MILGGTTYFQFMKIHNPYLFLTLTIIALIYTIVKTFTTERAINKIKQGRDGEIEIANYLDNALRDLLTGTTIRVFHDIPRNKGNIDHILICDRGIYLIETKTLSKSTKEKTMLSYDGGDHIYLHTDNKKTKLQNNPIIQTRNNVTWLKTFLREQYDIQGLNYPNFHIKGVVLFPGHFIKDDQPWKYDTWVLHHKSFAKFLAKAPTNRLSKDNILNIAGEITRLIRTN